MMYREVAVPLPDVYEDQRPYQDKIAEREAFRAAQAIAKDWVPDHTVVTKCVSAPSLADALTKARRKAEMSS